MKTTLAARTVLLLFLLLGHQLWGQVRVQARNPAGVFTTLTASNSVVDFGLAGIDGIRPSTVDFRLTNLSGQVLTDPLVIFETDNSIVINPQEDSEFFVSGLSPVLNTEDEFTIRFAPSCPIEHEGTITIRYGSDVEIEFSVIGEGFDGIAVGPPASNISRFIPLGEAFDLGDVAVRSSRSTGLTIANFTGRVFNPPFEVRLNGVLLNQNEISDRNAIFSFNGLSSPLFNNNNSIFTIFFAPADLGPVVANIQIDYGQGNIVDFDVVGEGTGADTLRLSSSFNPNISGSTINNQINEFIDLDIGLQSSVRFLELSAAARPTRITNITVTDGPWDLDLSALPSFPFTIGQFEDTPLFPLVFRPPIPGEFNGTLTIESDAPSDAPSGLRTIDLFGRVEGTADFILESSSSPAGPFTAGIFSDFGSFQFTQQPIVAPRFFRLVNRGPQPINLTEVTVSGTGFTGTSNLNLVAPAGGSSGVFVVNFNAIGVRDYIGEVSVSANNAGIDVPVSSVSLRSQITFPPGVLVFEILNPETNIFQTLNPGNDPIEGISTFVQAQGSNTQGSTLTVRVTNNSNFLIPNMRIIGSSPLVVNSNGNTALPLSPNQSRTFTLGVNSSFAGTFTTRPRITYGEPGTNTAGVNTFCFEALIETFMQGTGINSLLVEAFDPATDTYLELGDQNPPIEGVTTITQDMSSLVSDGESRQFRIRNITDGPLNVQVLEGVAPLSISDTTAFTLGSGEFRNFEFIFDPREAGVFDREVMIQFSPFTSTFLTRSFSVQLESIEEEVFRPFDPTQFDPNDFITESFIDPTTRAFVIRYVALEEFIVVCRRSETLPLPGNAGIIFDFNPEEGIRELRFPEPQTNQRFFYQLIRLPRP